MKRSILAVLLASHSLFLLCQEEEPKRPDPYKELELAQKLFKEGSFNACLEIVDAALDRGWGPDWTAPYTYLKGLVLSRQKDQQDTALQAMVDARALYLEIEVSEWFSESDRNTNLLNVDMGLANMYLEAGDHQAASDYLEKVMARSPVPSGYAYSLSARLLIEEGRFSEALVQARQSLNAYTDPVGKAQSRALIGLLLILEGHADEGLDETLKSQKGVIKGGDLNHYYYSLANMVLYHRCKNGSEPAHTVRAIEKYLDESYDRGLARTFEFVRTVKCP